MQHACSLFRGKPRGIGHPVKDTRPISLGCLSFGQLLDETKEVPYNRQVYR
jgi:hypothetical protein